MVCLECGGRLDESKPYRYMDVYHEANNEQKMRIYANESCIIGWPNELNWQQAVRVNTITGGKQDE